jgi:hypothetical protein
MFSDCFLPEIIDLTAQAAIFFMSRAATLTRVPALIVLLKLTKSRRHAG